MESLHFNLVCSCLICGLKSIVIGSHGFDSVWPQIRSRAFRNSWCSWSHCCHDGGMVVLMAGNAFFCSFQFCRDFCLFQCGICGQVTKFRECRTTLNLPRKPQPRKFVENLRLKHFQCYTSAHIVVCPLGDDILFTDASKQDINDWGWSWGVGTVVMVFRQHWITVSFYLCLCSNLRNCL